MNKAQERSPGSSHTDLTQKLRMSTDSLSSGVGILGSSIPSTSRKMEFIPSFSLSQGKGKINENRDTDTPKKRNRRRERPRKNKNLQQVEVTPSTSSTPPSSPGTNNPKINYPKLIFKPTEKKNSTAHSTPKSPRIVHLGPRKESRPKKSLLEKCLSNLSLADETSNMNVSFAIEEKFTYEIYPVRRPPNSYLFRKRNSKHKYINLKSYTKLSKKTCVFKTKIPGLTSGALRNLGVVGTGISKQRKYYASSVVNDDDDDGRRASVTSLTRDPEPVEGTKQKKTRPRRPRYRKTEKENNESRLSQSGSFVEDRSIQVKHELTQESQTSTPTKEKKPRRERHRHNRSLGKEKKGPSGKFAEYITEEDAKNGLESGELIKGFLRVNPKNSRDSYVSNEDTSLADYYITSVADRNRALDGDEVVLRVKPQAEWSEGKHTATVVYILKKVHPRTAIGNLKMLERNNEFALFYPRDRRVPFLHIPSISWPNGFKANPKMYENILFAAKLIEWKEPERAYGVVTEALGLSGDLRVETMSILKEFCLDVTPFSPEMVQYLPKSKEIPQEELETREDIRKECVFTIDPLTARDLDDAVSVKELPNGNYEIGVHISDASYYLREGTPLDQRVSEKATTIYLVDTVYHMLPVELCLHCSLLPGQDKLAFSVFWEIDETGEVFSTRFARTVLNSCTQLAYEHAQQMIENPEKQFKSDELPQIYNGFTYQDLSRTVNVLQKIAVNLREARMRNGSLRIDQLKLLFSLSPRDGEPIDYVVYENKESHRLIEEFMLLANISVAKQINQSFPDIAFLRCHEPPKQTMLAEAQKCLETCGIHIDISSSGGIHSSLRKYITDDYQGLCRGMVLNHIFAKPMTRARYFCSGTMDGEEEYSHYALSVPIYTHFTSPIRRYADIMVHRLLAASLGYAEKPNWNMDFVCSIAANCNKQKYNAKRAGEASSDLYLAHFIEKHQPYIQDCVVVDVKDRSFDVICIKTGSIVRVYQNKCQDNASWKVDAIPVSGGAAEQVTKTKGPGDQEFTKKVLRLTVKFPKTKKYQEECTMIVEMFSVVKVELQRKQNSYSLEAVLLRPVVSRTFERNMSSSSTQQ